jgi:hypothetical protein
MLYGVLCVCRLRSVWCVCLCVGGVYGVYAVCVCGWVVVVGVRGGACEWVGVSLCVFAPCRTTLWRWAMGRMHGPRS